MQTLSEPTPATSIFYTPLCCKQLTTGFLINLTTNFRTFQQFSWAVMGL